MSKRKCAQSREYTYSHQEAEATGEDEVTSVEWITRAHRVEVGNECVWDNKSAWLNEHARGKECAKNKDYTGVKNIVIEHSKHWGTIAKRKVCSKQSVDKQIGQNARTCKEVKYEMRNNS